MARMRAPERRRQLLETAAAVFAERGYRGATTSELAAAAGVTEPILYRHFASKHDLFVTLITEVGREVIAAWRARLDETASPAERLRVLLESNPATHERGAGVYRVIFQAMTEPRNKGEITGAIRRHLARLHRFLRAEIERLQADGVVRDDEPAGALAWLLIDIAIGYGMVGPLELRGPDADRTDIQKLIAELIAVR